MNLYAIKITQPHGEFEYPETNVFVVLAGYTAEAVDTLRKDCRIGADSGQIEHVALIGENVTVPPFQCPTVLY